MEYQCRFLLAFAWPYRQHRRVEWHSAHVAALSDVTSPFLRAY